MKTGLALSGGGDKGAFSVGVVKKLLEEGNSFDAVSGTSTGALIAPLLCIPKGIDICEKFYRSVSVEDILMVDKVFLNVIKNQSIYSTLPLWNLIKKVFTQEVFGSIMSSSTELFITTVSLTTGKLTYYTNKILQGTAKYNVVLLRDRAHLCRAILASCSQPVLMPAINLDDQKHIDGGVKEYIPINILIDRGVESAIAVVTSQKDISYYNSDISNIKDVLLETINILTSDVAENDLTMAEHINKGLLYIEVVRQSLIQLGIPEETVSTIIDHNGNPFQGRKLFLLKVIRPERNLGGGLTFSSAEMNEMFQYGYNLST